MHRKQGGHGGGTPHGAGHFRQDRKQQQGVRHVQQEVHEVVHGRVQAEALHVGHVRQPGERMPIALVKGGQRPAHVFPGQPAEDMAVLRDVRGIVEKDKIRVPHAGVRHERNYRQQRADDHLRRSFHGLRGASCRGLPARSNWFRFWRASAAPGVFPSAS